MGEGFVAVAAPGGDGLNGLAGNLSYDSWSIDSTGKSRVVTGQGSVARVGLTESVSLDV